MNERTDNERLLEDVLAGEIEGQFRGTSLEHVLQLARRRRRLRAIRRVAVIAAVLLGAAMAGIHFHAPEQIKPEFVQSNLTGAKLAWVISPTSAIRLGKQRFCGAFVS